jgi:hypothetical protein
MLVIIPYWVRPKRQIVVIQIPVNFLEINQIFIFTIKIV